MTENTYYLSQRKIFTNYLRQWPRFIVGYIVFNGVYFASIKLLSGIRPELHTITLSQSLVVGSIAFCCSLLISLLLNQLSPVSLKITKDKITSVTYHRATLINIISYIFVPTAILIVVPFLMSKMATAYQALSIYNSLISLTIFGAITGLLVGTMYLVFNYRKESKSHTTVGVSDTFDKGQSTNKLFTKNNDDYYKGSLHLKSTLDANLKVNALIDKKTYNQTCLGFGLCCSSQDNEN